MCLDAGAEWQGYAADVTRTFPLSGDWPSREAKQIYDLVQRMQTQCMDMIGPGKRFVDAQYLAHLVAIEGLLELGIFHNGSKKEIYQAGTSVAFFPHGLGHHMGLEVHDVSTVLTKSADMDETVASEVHDYYRHSWWTCANADRSLRIYQTWRTTQSLGRCRPTLFLRFGAVPSMNQARLVYSPA
jgi:methionine aminopeptidase